MKTFDDFRFSGEFNSDTLWTYQLALEHIKGRLDHFIAWGKVSWPYDPAVLGLLYGKGCDGFSEDSSDEMNRPEESAEGGKSALQYIHEIHEWHDKHFGPTTLLEFAVAKELPGAVTGFHSLSAKVSGIKNCSKNRPPPTPLVEGGGC